MRVFLLCVYITRQFMQKYYSLCKKYLKFDLTAIINIDMLQ